ncbi:MAG: hypothetical protein QNJ37_01380 [Crocosphaera sp.]|nr:hypothetical protein [Crocosphaera sp.]
MTTINGKLVDLNLVKPEEEEFKTVYQPSEYEETEVEILQQSVNILANRIHEVESHASYLEKVCKKLEKEEKQNARKIMIITLVGTISLGTLGVWGGLSYQESLANKNTVNYTEIEEYQKR